MKQYLKMEDVFGGAEVNVRNGATSLIDCCGVLAANCLCPDTANHIAHAINSHDELVQMNQELLAELKAMAKAYVNLIEVGKDRIESLGGGCDDVTYLAAHDVDLVHACSVIGKYDGGAA